VRDITRKFPGLVQPSDYYLLLLFHVGGDKVAVHSPRVIKRNFSALGRLVRESGAQVIFSSFLPVAGGDVERNRQIISTFNNTCNNTWLYGGCHRHLWLF